MKPVIFRLDGPLEEFGTHQSQVFGGGFIRACLRKMETGLGLPPEEADTRHTPSWH
jgi:hypothetical protein